MANLDDLIQQAARGASSASAQLDPRVCEALMLAYYDFVFRLANSFLGDSSEAEDAAQETFIQAVQHIHQYHPDSSLKSWLAKITLNTCRMKYRRQKAIRRLQEVLQRITLQGQTHSPTPEEVVIQSERRQVVQRAVDALDEKHRLPVLLRYVHGFSTPEIAQILVENEGTIYSRLHYANRKLRDQLEGLVETKLIKGQD